jgi:hypothetical protein
VNTAVSKSATSLNCQDAIDAYMQVNRLENGSESKSTYKEAESGIVLKVGYVYIKFLGQMTGWNYIHRAPVQPDLRRRKLHKQICLFTSSLS